MLSHNFIIVFITLLIVVPCHSYALIPDFHNKRFALIIGNSDYTGQADLEGIPVNDAKDLSKLLERLGFKTTLLLDADKREMFKSLKAFKKNLKENPGSVALYFLRGTAFSWMGKTFYYH